MPAPNARASGHHQGLSLHKVGAFAKTAPNPAQFRRFKCQTELEAGGSVDNCGTSYKLVARLGSGCFAEVFKAQCSDTKLVVAFKVLPEDGDLAARFHQKEARRLLRLKHPNIVSASETFRFRGAQRIYTCIVMEYCGGGTLHGRIQSSSRFSLETILQFIYQMADGLDYLHVHDIIHGDLKSDNILLTTRNQPKISDFGHSRRTPGDDLSAPPMQGGDLMFAPPEYSREFNLSTSFDMWSLGCIICEMATHSTIASRSAGVPFCNNPQAFGVLMEEMKTAHGGQLFPFIRGLLVKDAKYRTTAPGVRQKAADMGGQCDPVANDDGETATVSSSGFKRLLEKITG